MNKTMDVGKVMLLGYGLSFSFMLVHIAMLVLFSYFGVAPMVWFNSFSIVFYMLSVLMLKFRKMWLYTISVYMEVVLHMTLAVIYVGVDNGFQVTLIGMNALGFYAEYLSANLNSRRVSGIALSSVGMLMYLGAFVYDRLYPAVYELPPNVSFWLQIAWGIIVFVVNIFFLKVFVTITLQSEQILSEAQTQANKMITAMSSDYRSVYYVNLDDDIGICYRADKTDKEQSQEGTSFPYYERFSWYGQNCVAESYRDGFMSFIDPDNIRKSLATKSIIAYRYLAVRNGHEYYEMLRMAGVRRVEDRGDHIVHSIGLGLTVIDEEMRETLAKNEALAEALTAAEEANKAKTAFLSSMSHEIRTPMNAIIGLDKLALRDDSTSEETREYLEKIGESADHLLALINDVLDMSRIESGRMVLRTEEFSFRSMLEQINTMVMAQCRDKGISYECRILSNVDDRYIGDDTKLKQVLINILSNAIKFTDAPGNVSLTVERTAMFENQSALRFCIKDTGIGMDEEFIPKIFDTFSQEDDSRKNKYGSTGLGMAITKNIVDMMNGEIDVVSEKGAGTEFIVTITLRNCTDSVTGADQTEESETAEYPESSEFAIADNSDSRTMANEKKMAELDGRQILLAEDIEINAEILIDILEMEDIRVEHAGNGRIAAEMFADSEPGMYSAILMDVRMPEMDGLEATELIRAMDREDAKRIPIIALTANAFDEDVQRSLQAGMNAHLSKPVEPEHLLQTLGELIYEAES